MSDLQGRTPDNNGRHYDFINSRIPQPFKDAALKRIQALAATQKGPARRLSIATHYNQAPLQDANLTLWSTQTTVDRLLDELQDIHAFAEPLLSTALKAQYGVEEM